MPNHPRKARAHAEGRENALPMSATTIPFTESGLARREENRR